MGRGNVNYPIAEGEGLASAEAHRDAIRERCLGLYSGSHASPTGLATGGRLTV